MTEPLDEDYLLAFAREQQRPTDPNGSSPWSYERCQVCRHTWHGMACDMSGCDCAISWREGVA